MNPLTPPSYLKSLALGQSRHNQERGEKTSLDTTTYHSWDK